MKIKSTSLFISEKSDTGAENDGDKKPPAKNRNFQDFEREP